MTQLRKESSDVMRDNMLINPSGYSGHWMGVDLNVEHNNLYQQVCDSYYVIENKQRSHLQIYFSSKGLHGTWGQLADLSPVMPLYRPLKKKFMRDLSSRYHGTAHTTPKLSRDIQKIMAKLRELDIYSVNINRKATNTTEDILEKGQRTLREQTMKTFIKRYEEMLQCNEVFADDQDELYKNKIVVEVSPGLNGLKEVGEEGMRDMIIDEEGDAEVDMS